MIWREEYFEFDCLTTFDLALLGHHSVVSLLVTQSDFIRVLFSVDWPMERHGNGWSIFEFDGAAWLCSWISVLEEDGFKGIGLKVNFLSINCHNIQVKHSTVSLHLVEIRSLVVTCKNHILKKLTFSLGVKRHIHIDCVPGVEVEFRGSDCEWTDSYWGIFGLSVIVFVPFAEELEPSITTVVHAAESHIHTVTQPGIQTVHWVHQWNDGRVSSSSEWKFEGSFLSHKSDSIIKVSKTWRLKHNRHRNWHSSSQITSSRRGVFYSCDSKDVWAWGHKLDSFLGGSDIGHFDHNFVNAVHLVLWKVDSGWLNSETSLELRCFCLEGVSISLKTLIIWKLTVVMVIGALLTLYLGFFM